MSYFVAENCIIEEDVSIGAGTKVWYFSHIRKGAKIGKDCVIGESCHIGEKVIIGNDVRVGNKAEVHTGVIIKDRVRVGVGVVFNNVRKALANKKGKMLDTIVDDDVSIGVGAIISAGVKIGVKAVIADGTMVFFDVPPNAFVAGNPGKIKSVNK